MTKNNITVVTQQLPKSCMDDLEKLKAQRTSEAPFRHWLKKLNKNDQLPRGKFFSGKVAGQPKAGSGPDPFKPQQS